MAIDISTLQVKVKSDGITQTVNKLEKLEKQADKTEAAVKKLGTNAIAGNMGASAGATVALTNALLLLNTTVGKLTTGQAQNTITQRANTEAMRDAHAAARGLAGSLGVLWMTYGNALPLMAGAAIGASFKAIATQGAELENTLNNIRVKGEVTGESMKTVKAAIMDLGQGIYGPQQVAGAMETMVMAGMKAEAAVAALAPALNLATVGGTTIEKAAYTLVQVGTAMGYTADSFGIVGDVIAKTAATSMSSVESLSEAFKSASSVGVVYGVTLKDLGVSLALLSNLGIQGSAAGTANKNFYKELDSDAKKVSGTLAKLGVDVERDLKIDGKFKDIGSIVKTLSEALDKAGDKSGKAMQAITNERGMRQMAALLQAYRSDVDGLSNAFQTAADDINNSAGFVALGAAQIALSTKNQMTSTLNTLKTSFADAFDAMAPQMNVVAHELKALFKSEEFTSGLKSIAKAMADFLMLLVRSAPLLLDVAKGFLAIRAAMLAHTVVMAMAGAMTVLSTAMAGASLAALSMSVALPPLLAVIALTTAAWAAYSYWKNNSLDTAKTQAQISTNAELLDSLKKEGDRLDKVNEHLAKGTDLTKAQAAATRDLAMAEMNKRNADAEAAAKAQFMDAFNKIDNGNKYKGKIAQLSASNDKTRDKDKDGNFTSNGRGLTMDSGVGRAILAYSNWNATMQESARAAKAVNDEVARVDGLSKETEFLTAFGQEKALKQAALRQRIAAADAGNPDVSPKPEDSKAKALAQQRANEAMELERLTAGYRARTEAVEEMTKTGVRAISSVQEARVKAGKFGNDAHMLKLAQDADEAKFEQQKANAIGENSNKLTEIANRDIARRAAEKLAGYENMGMMEKTTAAIMHQNSASKEQKEAQMQLARTADEVLRVEGALAKLHTATGSSEQRAQALIDEADAMQDYGRKAKQSAVQFAEAEVAKMKLAGTGSDAAIMHRMEAAGLEDVAKAYNNLTKLTLDFAKREELDNAIGVAGVLGAESAKVEAHRKATQDIIDSNIARAESGVTAARAGGDFEKIANAQAAYNKAIAEGKKASDLLKKYFTIDIKVAGLKDISTTFASLGKAANAMGEQFKHVGTALDGLSSAFSTLAEVQAKQGISEQERLQGQVGAYGDMASASASFFQEGSKGYNTLMGVSKVFHAAEMAMALVRMGQKAVEAVLTQGGGDPYTAWGRMAAMAAVVAGLGFAVGGGFNSGGGGRSAADVQKEQGTGGVFGDVTAKSDSIAKSLEDLKSNSSILLPVNQAMLASLRNIESSMSGLTNLVLRTSGLTEGTNMGIQTGNTGLGGVAGAIQGALSGVPILGKLASLWGKTSTNIVDSGLQYGGKVSDMQAGKGFGQYASVDTTESSWFGLSKSTSNAVQTQGLDPELSKQFGLIFTNLEETMKAAAPALGKNASAIGKVIDDMVFTVGGVSLKGLKGTELENAISTTLSKTMDQIAERAFPAMDDFRQVGEGYAQTVLRVASGVERANGALEALGIRAVAFTSIANKQGDVAVEIAKQSIAAAEGLSGVNTMLQGLDGTLTELIDTYSALDAIRKQMNGLGLNGAGLNVNVLKGAGGLSQLGSALSTYQDKFFTDGEKSAIMLKSLTAEFSKLGVKLPANILAYRGLIESTGVSTEASAKLTGQLLGLSGAYAELIDMNSSASKAATDNLNNSIDSLKKFSETINAFKDSLVLGDLSTLTPTEKYLEAKRQYESTVAKAMTGDATAQANVTGSASAYLEASRVVNASNADYSASFATVQADMDKLSAYTAGQLTEAEKQLEVLNKQADSLTNLNITAEGIKSSLDNLAVALPTIMPTPVMGTRDSDAAAELAKLRAEQAVQTEATTAALGQLGAMIYNVTQQAADKVADATTEASKTANYKRKFDIETFER